MKKLEKLFLVAVVLFSLWSLGYQSSSAFAGVPHLINYQGKLTDTGGVPLEGSYGLTFRIYDAETGGNLLWEETQNGVVVQKGVFSVLLGSVNNLGLTFDKAYFLEIKVGSEVMSPRQRITSAGYAIRAESLDGPGKVGTKAVDETNIGNDKSLVYKTASGKYELEDNKVTFANNIQTAGVSGVPNVGDIVICTVTKTITPGKTILVIATGNFTTPYESGYAYSAGIYDGAHLIDQWVPQTVTQNSNIPFVLQGVVTGLSGPVTFTLKLKISPPLRTSPSYPTGYGKLTVLEF